MTMEDRSAKKLALWHTLTFRPLITHDNLEPIMNKLGFIGLPVSSSSSVPSSSSDPSSSSVSTSSSSSVPSSSSDSTSSSSSVPSSSSTSTSSSDSISTSSSDSGSTSSSSSVSSSSSTSLTISSSAPVSISSSDSISSPSSPPVSSPSLAPVSTSSSDSVSSSSPSPPKAANCSWKEYEYCAAGTFQGRSPTLVRLPRPRLPYPRIDGLHPTTYEAFIEAVNFFLNKGDDNISEIFHVRSMPLDDDDRPFQETFIQSQQQGRFFFYRKDTLEDATFKRYRRCNNRNCKHHNNNNHNNDNDDKIIMIRIQDLQSHHK